MLCHDGCCARAGLVSDPCCGSGEGDTYWLAVESPLSLLTFFAAAKKVSAAPHRGIASKPLRKQGKANTISKQPNTRRRQKKPLPPQIRLNHSLIPLNLIQRAVRQHPPFGHN